MSTIINATTTNGVVIQPDNSGSLVLQTNNGTTALTISTAQDTTLAGKLTTASSGIQFSDASSQTAAASPYVLKNRIINGAMVIDQRNAGASVTPASGNYTLDRWFGIASQSSKFTIQQNAAAVTPPTGFTNYLGITSSSAYSIVAGDFFGITQRIEGFNIADLDFGTANAKTVTLSFWVRSSLTGTFGGSVTNSAGNRSYPFTYTISSANTWEQKTVTIAGETSGTWITNNGVGMQLRFGVGVGSTFSGTAGAWATSNFLSATGATSVVGTDAATWYITGVQLEVGTTATPFERRLYGQELANCQRYYYTTGSLANPSNTASGIFAMPLASDLPYAIGATSFKVPMRASPTIILYDSAGTSGTVTQHGVAVGIAVTASVINQNGFNQLQRTSGSFTNGNYPVTGGYTASIEL